jgi:F-type H+-transporting ATPase subunit gamma
MSDKLSAVQAHIAGVEGLESVVGAMRGIAAARSREARQRITGIRACADIVGAAISDALMLENSDQSRNPAQRTAVAESAESTDSAGLTIVFCAEQGFVGAFNEHVIDNASRQTGTLPGDACFMIGERGLAPAMQHGLKVIWSTPMVAHADEVPALADRITEALYTQLNAGHFSHVRIVHAAPNATADIHVIDEALLPLDFTRFAISKRRFAPLVTLPVPSLLAKLAEEYIYTQLCEAIMLSFAAENDARMHAMVAARTNVRNTLDRLIGDFRRLRQEEITAEIVELSAGSATAR